MSTSKRIRPRILLGGLTLVALALGAGGCSCNPDPGVAMLEITAPTSGAALSLGSDTDPVAPGVQIDVSVLATDLSVGEAVRVEVDGVPAGSATVPSDGMITITGVTVGSGTHTLVASARAGGVVSPGVTVSVTDSCFAVAFVTPEPGDTLGASDDTDGDACGMTFETTVVATASAPDGAEARILVNGSSRRTGTVMAGQVRFTGVGLDNRGTTANALRVEVTSDGTTCGADLASGILVDCDGASCAITSPSTDTPFLNADDDTSAADGFQGDFAVTTDASGGAQPVRLIIDGNESGAESATPSGMVASFGGVELTEGTHRFVAECRTAAGNITRSGPAEWTVDITPCGVTFDDPVADTLYVDADDLDADPSNGVQILGSGTAGSDCQGLRVAQCSGIEAAPFAASSATWSEQITLASAAMQDLCAQTQDAAGNVSEALVPVRLATEAPQVEIASPTDDSAYNLAGTAGRTADLTGGNTTCEAAFEVFCTAVDTDVQLILSSSDTVIGTASCTADVSVPAPYAGRATFASVSLPTLSDGSAYSVFSRQTDDRLTGDSAPISLRADCVAPVLTISRPTCGATLLPDSQDENPGTPEFEYRTQVTRLNDSDVPVTLMIESSGGGVVYMATDSTVGAAASFPVADYSAGGMLSVTGTGTDNAGNVGTTAACSVTVENLPSVILTAPVMNQVLSSADDCSGDAGLQIQVSGTTDAAPGSSVDVEVGGVAAGSDVVAGGAFSLCVDATDGRSVTIDVTVTDTRGAGSASVVVVIDTMPPTATISDLMVAVQDRRGGVARFTWTAIADADGSPLTDYELRCADAAIASESDWDMARAISLLTTPGAPGAMESEDVDAFRTGVPEHCVLRGIDPAGALTPLAPSVLVDMPFEVLSRPGIGGSLGIDVTAVGDINGDMIDDVLVGGGGAAYLFFGSSDVPPAVSATPDVVFSPTSAAPFFGRSLAGLGDVNGDGRPDFAFSDAGTSVVYIYFGHDMNTPWMSACDPTGVACPADVVITGGVFFGFDIQSAGDFDGDGSLDLAIGNSFTGAGEVFVALGPFSIGQAFEIPAGVNPEPDGFRIAAPAGVMNSFGAQVGTVGGDATGDGRHDIIIGASSTMGNTTAYYAAGAMYTGAAGDGLIPLPASSLFLLESGTTNQAVGNSVQGAGDVDGDGRLDILLGEGLSSASGRVSTYLGDGAMFSTASRFYITNDSPSPDMDRFGNTLGVARHASPLLGNLGDLDLDGLSDILAGSAENGSADGSAHLYYGVSPFAARVRSSGLTFPAAAGDGRRRVGYIGDVNGDGFNDIAVGEPTPGSLHILY